MPSCLDLCVLFNHIYLNHLLALGLPGQVGEVCPLIPNLEKSLEEIMELAESGMRYTQMPHVMEVGYTINFLKNAYQPYIFFSKSSIKTTISDH